MENEYILMTCPHCHTYIQIYKSEINCAIFRHGIVKVSGQQMSPHASREECDFLFDNGLIYGCGRPFRVFISNGNYSVEECDYI